MRSRSRAVAAAVTPALAALCMVLGACSPSGGTAPAEPPATPTRSSGSDALSSGSTHTVGADPAPSSPAAEPAAESTAPTPPPESGGTEPASGPVPWVVSAIWTPDGTAVEVTGMVPGVIESDGTCRAVVSLAGMEYVAETEGMADATATACGAMRVPVPSHDAVTVFVEYAPAGMAARRSAPLEVAP